MAELRGFSQLMDILKQPLFASTTVQIKRPATAKSKYSGRPDKLSVEVFDLCGLLTVMGEVHEIDGVQFKVAADTWVVGVAKTGLRAKAKGTCENGVRVANCLVIL